MEKGSVGLVAIGDNIYLSISFIYLFIYLYVKEFYIPYKMILYPL